VTTERYFAETWCFMTNVPANLPAARRRVLYGLAFLAAGALLLTVMLAARDAARQDASRSNLERIGLALQHYHDTHG
jgi:hypothetical protein